MPSSIDVTKWPRGLTKLLDVHSNFVRAKEDIEALQSGSGLANGAITTSKLADGAVTTSKVADGVVTRYFGTPQDLTNLNYVDYLGIPSNAKRIVVLFWRASGALTALTYIQVYAGGTLQTSGYEGVVRRVGEAGTDSTEVFPLFYSAGATKASGAATIYRLNADSNTWVYHSLFAEYGIGDAVLAGGSITLPDVLTGLRFVIYADNNHWTSGTMNIIVEA